MFGFRHHVHEFLVGNIVSRSSFKTFQSVSCLPCRASDTVKVCDQMRKERWWLYLWPRLRDEVSQHGPHMPLLHHSSAEGNRTIMSRSPSLQRSKLKNICCLLERTPMSVHNQAMQSGKIHRLALCIYTSSPRGKTVYLLLGEIHRTKGGQERRLPICLHSPQNSSQLSQARGLLQ